MVASLGGKRRQALFLRLPSVNSMRDELMLRVNQQQFDHSYTQQEADTRISSACTSHDLISLGLPHS